jgi:hypothetical protein
MRSCSCGLILFLFSFSVFAAPAPEPFKTNWDRPVDPDRDCKFVFRGGTLTIELPRGDHELAPKRNRFNAPRLLRDVEGDFVMQVRVCASFQPSDNPSVDGEDPRVAAGLVLIPADKNCIRLEYAAYRRKGEHSCGPAFQMKGEQIWNMYQDGLGMSWKPPIGKRNEESIYLRLERRGRTIYHLFSPDGEKWEGGRLYGAFGIAREAQGGPGRLLDLDRTVQGPLRPVQAHPRPEGK